MSSFSKFERISSYSKLFPNVKLMTDVSVIRWIFGLHGFQCKTEEDEWGKTVVMTNLGVNVNKQWTTLFSEQIAKEILILLGHNPKKPNTINGFRLDIETENELFEIKSNTFFTNGTAVEKISNVMFKYGKHFEKPVIVICFGEAERYSKDKNGIIFKIKNCERTSEMSEKFGVYFCGATDLIDYIYDNKLAG